MNIIISGAFGHIGSFLLKKFQKNDRIKKMYQTSIDNKKKVRFFRKVKEGVLDMGLYLPVRFHKGFVKLLKN